MQQLKFKFIIQELNDLGVIINNVKPLRQKQKYTCGPAVLATIFKFYGKEIPEEDLVQQGNINSKDGTDYDQMEYLAKQNGFKFYHKLNASVRDIEKYLKLNMPVIVNYQDWGGGHYSVIHGYDDHFFYVADPSNSNDSESEYAEPKKISRKKFLKNWFDSNEKGNYKKTLILVAPKHKEFN